MSVPQAAMDAAIAAADEYAASRPHPDPLGIAGAAVKAAAAHITAAERDRMVRLARDHAFTLFRPAYGPGDVPSIQVVPLEALEKT